MSLRRPGSAVRGWCLTALAAVVFATQPVTAEDLAPQPLFDDCDGPRCLGVTVSAALLARMDSDEGVPLQDFIDGLRVRYAGDEPLHVRLVAARYQNGRLVRYGVSARTTLEPEGDGLTVREGERALHEAFRPVTERDVRIRSRPEVDGDRGFRAATARFIGSLPPTYLAGGDGGGLVTGLQDGNGTALARYHGPVGVAVLVPENHDLRSEDDVASIALMVALEPIAR